jgi:Fe-S cluster assembly ATPase SufC
MLKIQNLHAGIEEKKILNGIDLEIKARSARHHGPEWLW